MTNSRSSKSQNYFLLVLGAFVLFAALYAIVYSTLKSQPSSLKASASYPTCNFTTSWGTLGSGNGQLNNPYGLVTLSSGNPVWVVDMYNNRIESFTSEGIYEGQFGSAGSGSGQFNEPRGVAIDEKSMNPYMWMYVADSKNNRVQKFSLVGVNGTFQTMWGTPGTGNGQFNRPWDVAVDSQGNVYVTDVFNNRVQKFSSTGTFLLKWGTPGTGNGQFNEPTGITVDAADNVYVVDTQNFRVQKFNSNGLFLTKWGTQGTGDNQFGLPVDIQAKKWENTVFVTDAGNYQVKKFTNNGQLLAVFGSFGRGNGQFYSPYMIGSDETINVFITDTYNNRVEKFWCPVFTPTPAPTPISICRGKQPICTDCVACVSGVWKCVSCGIAK